MTSITYLKGCIFLCHLAHKISKCHTSFSWSGLLSQRNLCIFLLIACHLFLWHCCTFLRTWGILSFCKMYYKKHAYSNILKIFQPKNENFQIKNTVIFNVSAQNRDCGYSLELPWWGSLMSTPNLCSKQRLWVLIRTALMRQFLMSTPNLCFWAEIRKIMYTPVNPSFTKYKWGLRGQNYIGMFSADMVSRTLFYCSIF